MRLNKSLLSIRSYMSFIYIHIFRKIRTITAFHLFTNRFSVFVCIRGNGETLSHSHMWTTSAGRSAA